MLIFINLAPSLPLITEVILIRWLKELSFYPHLPSQSQSRISETKGTLGDLPQNHSTYFSDLIKLCNRLLCIPYILLA